MSEKVKRVIESWTKNGIEWSIVETYYEFGTHYVLLCNGVPEFHATDLQRVRNYMRSWIR